MIRKCIQTVLRVIQKILIFVLLTLVYFIGFGITYICALLFKRELFKSNNTNALSFWRDAEGYDMTMKECTRQS